MQFVFGHTHTRRNIYSCNLVIKKSNIYSLFDSVIFIRSTRSFGEIIDLISLGKSYTISLKTHTLFITYNSTLLNQLYNRFPSNSNHQLKLSMTYQSSTYKRKKRRKFILRWQHFSFSDFTGSAIHTYTNVNFRALKCVTAVGRAKTRREKKIKVRKHFFSQVECSSN